VAAEGYDDDDLKMCGMRIAPSGEEVLADCCGFLAVLWETMGKRNPSHAGTYL